MTTDSMSWFSFAAYFSILLIAFILLRYYKLPLSKSLLSAVVRMTVQLLLVAVYLQTIFDIDNPWINFAWFALMVFVTSWTGTGQIGISRRFYFWPFLIAVVVGALPILLFTVFILANPTPWYQAQYIIPLGGMLLGNALKGVIVGVERFFAIMRDQQQLYLQYVSLGATRREALAPIFRQAIQAALSPAIASMATVGVVALPGMMTGQILAGAEPMQAIQYQIAILLAIYVTEMITVVVALELCARRLIDTALLPRLERLKDQRISQ